MSDSDGIDEALQGALYVGATAAARRAEVAARERQERARAETEMSRAAVLAYRREMGQEATWDEGEESRLAATPAQESYMRGVGLRPDGMELSIADASAILTAFEAGALGRGNTEGARRLMATRRLTASAEDGVETAPDARHTGPGAGANRMEPTTAEASAVVAAADLLDQEARSGDVENRREVETDGAGGPLEETAADTATHPGDAGGSATSEARYDSAQRRLETARALEGIENRVAVEARLTADVAQARPAQEAVSGSRRGSPRARRRRTSGMDAGRDRERGGRTR